MLEITATSLATGYWAAEFGCAPDEWFAEPFRLVTHRGQFTDYHVVFGLFRHTRAVVSVPSGHAEKLRPMLTHLAHGCSPEALAAALEPVTKKVIGPAYLGYTSNIASPAHPARALNSGDSHAVQEMQRSCDPVEWQHGGSSIENPCSGVFVDGQLAALAGYETWGNSIAHISVITHPAWRGRGFAGSAVAHLGQRALAARLLPQYRTLESNLPSIHVARSLGFQPYARSLAIRLKEGV